MEKRILVYGMTDNLGGIETYLMNLMQEVNKYEVKFDFICDFPSISYSELISEYNSKVYFIPAKSKGLLKHWKELVKILLEHKEYNTVYFNVLDAGTVFTMLIPWLLRKKIVTHSHNNETTKKKLHRYCRPALVLMTKQYLACSQSAAEYMFGKIPHIQKKVVLVPNAIDFEKYKYNTQIRDVKRKELKILDNMCVIGHVGRLSEQKNPFGMLDIFKEVLKREKNTLLLSIGTGELDEEVKAYASELGIEKHVKFMGKRTDVHELFQAMDVFFFPSFYEGFGIVVLEAQAAGLKCVVSNNIPHEVDITGNVSFIDLDSKATIWADELLKRSKQKRCSVEEKLEESEFNIKNYGQIVDKLLLSLCE